MTVPTPDGMQIALTLTSIAAVWLSWAKFLAPRVKRRFGRILGFIEAVAGREAIVDKASGVEMAPAVPPLGVRLASMDETMQKLVAVMEANHDNAADIASVTGRVAALEVAAIERIATKTESANMWAAVANADTELGQTANGT